jgi:hypothetical protein
MYRIEAEPAAAAAPDEQARFFLASEADRLGLSPALDDLTLFSNIQGRYSSHLTYQQTYHGIPVYNRFVRVNLDRNGRPTMILNGFEPRLAAAGFSLDITPRLTSNDAMARAEALFEQDDLQSTVPELVVYPDAEPRLAWRFVVWPLQPAVEIEVLIDAHNDTLLNAQNLSTHVRPPADAGPIPLLPPARYDTPVHPVSAANDRVVDLRVVSQPHGRPATGSGLVFDPDPLTRAGFPYGPPYVDGGDTDILEVNAQRIQVDLLDITQGTDGLYRLVGPHVQIVSQTSGGAVVYTPPAEASPVGFQYTRANDFFEAVNVYYHIDKSQRYLQSLDIGRDIQNLSLRVNPHGLGLEDNSRYFSTQNYIAFGIGGVDDAEDAHVIWHEYGHALLQGSAPGLLSGVEGQALHEGWADYWAASYARSLVESGQAVRADWQTLFKWDSGDGTLWPGRAMTFTGKYPDDTFCDEGSFECDIYSDGMLWATTLMQIYETIGRTATDRVSLA